MSTIETNWSLTTDDLLRRRILKQIKRPIDLTTVSFTKPKPRRKGSSHVVVEIIPNEGSSFPKGKTVEYELLDIQSIVKGPLRIRYRGQVNTAELLYDVNRALGTKLCDTDVVRKRIAVNQLPLKIDLLIEEGNYYFKGSLPIELVDDTKEVINDGETMLLNADLRPIRNYLLNLIPGQKIDSLFVKQLRSVDPLHDWGLRDDCSQFNLKNARVLSSFVQSKNSRTRTMLIELCPLCCKGILGYLKLVFD